MEKKYKPHISKKKERDVASLVTLIKQYPVIGILDMTNLPALQFQRIRSKLRDVIAFRMIKKRLIKIAFDNTKNDKKGIEKLKERLTGIPALIFTKEDPFKLAKILKQEISPAAAKPGQISPDDIAIPAGPTPFIPGPMIGELGVMGIKTMVQNGKIHIREDKIIVKKGEVINNKVADLLAKLNVEPMQVGFNLLLTFKDGEIIEKDVLFVDDKLYYSTLQQYARECMDLAVYIGYISKDTVQKLLGKAYNEAKYVSAFAKLDGKMEEVKQEEKEEEAPKKEETLKSITATDGKVEVKPPKEVTKTEMEIAAKQLQELQDKAIQKANKK